MKNLLLAIQLLLIIIGFYSCEGISGNSFVPAIPGYISDQHSKVVLKRPLREISGIDYISESQLVAINDEVGKLFFVDPSTGKYQDFDFAKKDDYEDVVRTDSFYYVMNSEGHLYEIAISSRKLQTIYRNKFGKFMEFESLCYDRAQQQLLLICKECGKRQNSVNAYRFNLQTKEYFTDPFFEISWSDIRKLAKDNGIECKPSAAAINPVNDKLYIIASLGKVLLQCTLNGKLEAVYGLNPDHFPQPEGITFSRDGNMYIANEGIQGKGTLLKFLYRP